jgi:hypothetical protein
MYFTKKEVIKYARIALTVLVITHVCSKYKCMVINTGTENLSLIALNVYY